MDNKHAENNGSNMLLTGCIFLANLDVTGFVDYAIKAIIGDGIWLGYKMTADYIDKKKKQGEMSFLSKILTTSVLGAGAWAGWSYLKNLKTAGAELEVVPKATIHQLNWDGLTTRLDVLLKNPTKGSFSLKAPFVKLIYKDTVVGSSTPVDKDIKIPAHGQVMIDKIMVQIPMVGVFSLAFTLIKALIAGGSETLMVRTLTTIDLGIIKLPYETKQEITIKK